MYFKRSGMVSSQVMLLYSSYSFLGRAVGVSRRWRDNGGDLSDLWASIVARHIINVHLWEKSRPLPLSLCHLRSAGLPFLLLFFFSLLCSLLQEGKHTPSKENEQENRIHKFTCFPAVKRFISLSKQNKLFIYQWCRGLPMPTVLCSGSLKLWSNY